MINLISNCLKGEVGDEEELLKMMMTVMMTNLMSNSKEGEVNDEEEDLVAEQDVRHEGDKGKPEWMKMMMTMKMIMMMTVTRINMLKTMRILLPSKMRGVKKTRASRSG